jgi:hydroxymethylpyrimidine/phosphomethylpyrimidine kinase
MPARVLVVAGSDSSGGAGLQADIKTITVLGGYASTAITAITAQDTCQVRRIQAVPAEMVALQMSMVLADMGADCIKIGMLFSSDTVQAVAGVLSKSAQRVPVVLDPVLLSSSGSELLSERGLGLVVEKLLPQVALVTPNLSEAGRLCGFEVKDPAGMTRAAHDLRKQGARAVLIKGGHLEGEHLTDFLLCEHGEFCYSATRIDTPNTHGTGCTLASAIACVLAQGFLLPNAVERARAYLQRAIKNAWDLGRGPGPLNHLPGPRA